MGDSKHVNIAALTSAEHAATDCVFYAICYSAIRLRSDGSIEKVNGLHVIHEKDDESALRAAMQIATDKYKTSDGYVGHSALAMSIFIASEETAPNVAAIFTQSEN